MNDAIIDEEKALLAELEAIEAARDQKRDQVVEKTRTLALRERIEKAKRELAEAEKLDELIEEHGPLGKAIRVVTTVEGHMVVVKAPGRQQFRKYQSAGFDKPSAQDDIVRACLVYPSKADFESLANRWPAIVTQAANEIVFLASGKQEEIPGK